MIKYKNIIRKEHSSSYVPEMPDYIASRILDEVFLACGREQSDFYSAKKRAEEHYEAIKGKKNP